MALAAASLALLPAFLRVSRTTAQPSQEAAQPSQEAAQPAQEPVRVHLSVQADARCATAAELIERVRVRSQRIQFGSDTGDVPRVLVAIRAGADRDRVAELSMQWPDGRRSERRLHAGSCAAALDALALLTAMTLDPAAHAEATAAPELLSADPPGRAGDAGPATSPSASERDPQASDAGSEAEPVEPAPQDAAPRPTKAPERVEPAEGSSPSKPFFLAVEHVAVGLSAELALNAAPRAMPGFGLYALLALQGIDAWAPALSLELSRTWAFELSEAGGQADFELQVAKLDACPLGLSLPPFAARACAAFALGRMLASGARTYTPQSHSERWASLGGTLLFTLAIGSVIELRSGFGVARPLIRHDFAFRPEVFHRVPRLAFEGHLGAGVRFR